MPDQRLRQSPEQIGLGTGCRESEADAAFGLDDASGDFHKPKPKGRELRGCEIADLGMASRTVSKSQ